MDITLEEVVEVLLVVLVDLFQRELGEFFDFVLNYLGLR